MKKNYKKIFMIIGNGFNFDFLEGEKVSLNPSKPFSKFLNKTINIDDIKSELLKLNRNSKKDGVIKILDEANEKQDHFDIIKDTMNNLHNEVKLYTSISKFYKYTFNSSINRSMGNEGFGLCIGEFPSNIDPKEITRLMSTGKIDDYMRMIMKASVHECELRQFIVLMYVKYQQYLDNYISNDMLKSWKWYLWIRENFQKLLCVYTFNYDMFFERILDSLHIKYRRVGIINEKGDFPIIKNHGSIDFDSYIGNFNSEIKRRRYDNSFININRLVHTDGTFSINKTEELHRLRVYPDIVLPTQRSYQLDLKWVKEGLNYYKSIANEIDCFVIVGFSYWDVDEEEFNGLVENLPEGKIIDFYIVNPEAYSKKLEKFKNFIESKQHNYIGITDGVPWH